MFLHVECGTIDDRSVQHPNNLIIKETNSSRESFKNKLESGFSNCDNSDLDPILSPTESKETIVPLNAADRSSVDIIKSQSSNSQPMDNEYEEIDVQAESQDNADKCCLSTLNYHSNCTYEPKSNCEERMNSTHDESIDCSTNGYLQISEKERENYCNGLDDDNKLNEKLMTKLSFVDIINRSNDLSSVNNLFSESVDDTLSEGIVVIEKEISGHTSQTNVENGKNETKQFLNVCTDSGEVEDNISMYSSCASSNFVNQSEYLSLSSEYSSLNTNASLFSSAVASQQSDIKKYVPVCEDQALVFHEEHFNQFDMAKCVDDTVDKYREENFRQFEFTGDTNHDVTDKLDDEVSSCKMNNNDAMIQSIKSSSSSSPPSPYSPTHYPAIEEKTNSRTSSPTLHLPTTDNNFPFFFYSQPNSLEYFPPSLVDAIAINTSCPDLNDESLFENFDLKNRYDDASNLKCDDVIATDQYCNAKISEEQNGQCDADKDNLDKEPSNQIDNAKQSVQLRRRRQTLRRKHRSLSTPYPPCRHELYPKPKQIVRGLNCTDLKYNISDFQAVTENKNSRLKRSATEGDEPVYENIITDVKDGVNESTDKTDCAKSDGETRNSISANFFLPLKNLPVIREIRKKLEERRKSVDHSPDEKPLNEKSDNELKKQKSEDTDHSPDDIWSSQYSSMRDSGYGTNASDITSPISDTFTISDCPFISITPAEQDEIGVEMQTITTENNKLKSILKHSSVLPNEVDENDHVLNNDSASNGYNREISSLDYTEKFPEEETFTKQLQSYVNEASESFTPTPITAIYQHRFKRSESFF